MAKRYLASHKRKCNSFRTQRKAESATILPASSGAPTKKKRKKEDTQRFQTGSD